MRGGPGFEHWAEGWQEPPAPGVTDGDYLLELPEQAQVPAVDQPRTEANGRTGGGDGPRGGTPLRPEDDSSFGGHTAESRVLPGEQPVLREDRLVIRDLPCEDVEEYEEKEEEFTFAALLSWSL